MDHNLWFSVTVFSVVLACSAKYFHGKTTFTLLGGQKKGREKFNLTTTVGADLSLFVSIRSSHVR